MLSIFAGPYCYFTYIGGGFPMSGEVFSSLKSYLREYLVKNVPGAIYFFNILCTLTYRADCISLLLESPSKLYSIVLSHYRGDVVAADYAFTLLFVNPIVNYLKKPDIARQLLDYAKTGRDSDFVEVVKKFIVKGISS